MKIKGRFLTTGIGSLPYSDAGKSVQEICNVFDIPFWPQLPKKSFKENMYVQFAEGLPELVIDEDKRRIFVDTSKDLSEGLGRIYEAYLSEDYASFGISEGFAEGFYAFLDRAGGFTPYCVKGQITGPVSFGLSVVDEKGRSIIYNDTLKEGVIKLLEIKAAFQIEKLKKISDNMIIFIDEPYLTSFGSSFVNIGREEVILMLNSVIDKIHSSGALSAIHCCGNTDWSLLTDTEADIINFDAYSYAEGLSLYPGKIAAFLKRGGYLAWGIVPTSEDARKETEKTMFSRLSSEIIKLEQKGVPRSLLLAHSLVTPSCGMGTLSEDLTDIIIKKLPKVSKLAKDALI
jgi:methionine synthase II (cobalamin-independent)